jgi:hypothetical protein
VGLFGALVALLFLGGWFDVAGSRATGATARPAHLLFDDFSYTSSAQLRAHGWIVRTKAGWPGIAGAHWSADNVSFVNDPANAGNRLMRMSSATDGTVAGTSQTQVCHQRKYFQGTYATRVRFRSAPTVGPDGDQLVETFYAISPLAKPLDPAYSELDWEYLPNGGWGLTPPTLYATSWDTVQLDPWIARNRYTTVTRSLDGWHTLVLQVAAGVVTYFLDGIPIASHGEPYYPNVPMSINYNLWFIQGGQLPAGETRRYDEDVDWVLYRAGVVLSPGRVAEKVAKLRRGKIHFEDTVPRGNPPLASPCNF